MTDLANVVTDMEELLAQAQRAESSLDFRASIVGAQLRSAKYRGKRELTLPSGTHATMHAVTVDDGPSTVRDVMYCRTPELAKFIVLLLQHGEAAIGAYYESLRGLLAEGRHT